GRHLDVPTAIPRTRQGDISVQEVVPVSDLRVGGLRVKFGSGELDAASGNHPDGPAEVAVQGEATVTDLDIGRTSAASTQDEILFHVHHKIPEDLGDRGGGATVTDLRRGQPPSPGTHPQVTQRVHPDVAR